MLTPPLCKQRGGGKNGGSAPLTTVVRRELVNMVNMYICKYGKYVFHTVVYIAAPLLHRRRGSGPVKRSKVVTQLLEVKTIHM